MLLVLPNSVLVRFEVVKLLYIMKYIFASLSVDAVLLMNATDAFDKLNHQVSYPPKC